MVSVRLTVATGKIDLALLFVCKVEQKVTKAIFWYTFLLTN